MSRGSRVPHSWTTGPRVHDIDSIRETNERRGLANHRHVASMVCGVVVLRRHVDSVIVDQNPVTRLVEGPRQFSRRAVGGCDLSSFRAKRAPELLEDWLHAVAPRRRRELEVARAMRRGGAEPAFEHQSRESLGLHAVAGAVVIPRARGALREQDEPCQA